jgi:hypothetical protein
MLRTIASGSEIGLPGRISAGFQYGQPPLAARPIHMQNNVRVGVRDFDFEAHGNPTQHNCDCKSKVFDCKSKVFGLA